MICLVFFSKQKKMPITHIQNKAFDFSSATFEEKKDLVKILLEKERSLSQIVLETYPSDIFPQRKLSR